MSVKNWNQKANALKIMKFAFNLQSILNSHNLSLFTVWLDLFVICKEMADEIWSKPTCLWHNTFITDEVLLFTLNSNRTDSYQFFMAYINLSEHADGLLLILGVWKFIIGLGRGS